MLTPPMQYMLPFDKDKMMFYLPILYRMDVDARKTRLFALKALVSMVKLPSARKSTSVIVEDGWII